MSEMTPTTEAGRVPTTKVGRALFTDNEPMDMWESTIVPDDICDVEAEAAAAERERLRAIETDRTLRFAFMTPDEWAADALADISAEDREALRRALLTDPAEPEPSE